MFSPSELREMHERRRIADKHAAVAAERRSGVSGADLVEDGAREWLRRSGIRRPTTSIPDDIKVSVDDLDSDLIGAGAVGNEYRRRLDAAIQTGMEQDFGDFLSRIDPETRAAVLARPDVDSRTRRRFADQTRVSNELGKSRGYTPPPKPEPKPELTMTALIEEGARDFLSQLDKPKRTRRR